MSRILAGLLACALLVPATARAWTDAEVTRATAHVELDRELRARVTLVLSVRVHGGWLEGLDLEGLDPDMVLDESKPPWAIDAEGQKRSPAVRIRGEGRLSLSFGRHDNPRRGTLEVGLVYTTTLAGRSTLAPSDGHVRVVWALPSWRSGLDGVTITVSGPPGTVPASDDGAMDGSTTHTVFERDGLAVVEFHRVHLPRTVAFAVAVDVPEDEIAEALRAAPEPVEIEATQVTRPRVTRSGPPLDPAALVAFALALVVVLARDRFTRACRARGAEPRPLFPGPTWVVLPIALALGATVAWAGPTRPAVQVPALVALALLGLFRPAVAHPVLPRLGALRRATPHDRLAARRAVLCERLGLTLLLDATTPLGLAALAALIASTAILADAPLDGPSVAGLGAVLLVVPFTSATRFALPRDAAARLDGLARLARRLALPAGVAESLVVRVSTDGALLDARLALVLAERPSGLDRLDIALGDARDSGGHRLAPALVVGTRDGSPAEIACLELLPGAHVEHGPGDRLARAVALDPRATHALAALVGALGRPTPLRADCEAA